MSKGQSASQSTQQEPRLGDFDGESRQEAYSQAEAAKRAKAYELVRFNEALNAFVTAWNQFTEEYRQQGTYNTKKAKAVRSAWRKVEPLLP